MAVLGLDGAIERLEVGGLYEKAAIAAVEAVMWLATIEEALRVAKIDWRANDPTGRELVNGLLYVRHQSTHELVVYARAAGGASFPLSFPLSFDTELRWRRWSDDLPLGDRKTYRDAYEHVIAGESPVQTLRQARDVLVTAAGLQ